MVVPVTSPKTIQGAYGGNSTIITVVLDIFQFAEFLGSVCAIHRESESP